MDFTGSISTLATRMMPFVAILRHDLRALCTSWLVRLWLAATVLLTLILLSSSWHNPELRTAPLIALLLFPYLVLPWSLVVMVLSVSPLSGQRAEAVADGILSRPVTRYEYLLASWTARVLLVWGVVLAVVVPALLVAALAQRPLTVPADTVTLYGTLASLGVVGLVLTFLVSMGFLLGTLLRNQLLALVVLVFLWFPVNQVLHMFSLEEFSPISLTQALPTLLRQPWRDTAGAAPANGPDLAALAHDASGLLSFLGIQPQAPPASRSGFFDRDDEFDDFRLGRVVLGYGVPTLLAISLATLCFCVRDV